MAEMTRDEVLSKVRKLFALAERAGTEAEAALAAERAQTILTKYKLSERDVRPEKREGVAEMRFDHGRRFAAWETSLLSGVARVLYCDCFTITGTSWYVLVGKPTDIAVAKETYEWLVRQVRRLTRRYNPEGVSGMSLQGHRKAFSLGCGQRVRNRLWEDFQAKQAGTASPQPLGTTINEGPSPRASEVRALVVQSEREVKHYMSVHHATGLKHVRTRARSAQRHAHSFEEGRRAGDTVQLRPGEKIGHQPTPRIK